MSKIRGKKCQFCEGTGTIIEPEHITHYPDGEITMADEVEKKCKICNGTGRELLFTFEEIGKAWEELEEMYKKAKGQAVEIPLTAHNLIHILKRQNGYD